MLLERLALGAAFLAAGVRAQSSVATSVTETGSSSTSTATDGPQTHEVKVGLAGFQFDPDELEANVGDTVRFEFWPPDHSVIRAAFGYPCIPWEYVYSEGDPFYSGVQWVNTVTDTTTFEIKVNDTEPLFYYCGAPDSCMVEGMIGVINPNKTHTLQKQKDAREEFPIALVPGDEWPKEGNPMSTVSGLAITETVKLTTTPTSDSSKDDEDDESNEGDESDDDHHHPLSAGQIAGIAIGGAAVLILAGIVIYFCGRRGGLEKGYRKSGYLGAGNTQPGPGPMSDVTYAGSPDMSKHVSSVQYGLGVNPQGSPPVSPGVNPQYGAHASPMTHGHQYQSITPPPPNAAQAPAPVPVELPTSGGPRNSPLPQYNNQPGDTYSWAPREEASYRPGEKA